MQKILRGIIMEKTCVFSLSSLSIIEVLSAKIVVALKQSFLFCFLLFSLSVLLSDKMLRMYLGISPTVLLCENLERIEAFFAV